MMKKSSEISEDVGQVQKSIDDAMEVVKDFGPPIRTVLDVTVPGHDAGDEHIDWKRKGWKYKHLLAWEEARATRDIAMVMIERIQDWAIRDEEGNWVPFEPFEKDKEGKAILNKYSVDALLELEPNVVSYITICFRQAYNSAGTPIPEE